MSDGRFQTRMRRDVEEIAILLEGLNGLAPQGLLFQVGKQPGAPANERHTLARPLPADAWREVADRIVVLMQGKPDLLEAILALGAGGVFIHSVVNFRSGEVADIAAHEREANKHGALILWDLSHATGVLDLKLGAEGARLATGCTYKYLNGGPGAPSFVYAARELASKLATPLPGWMGHAAPFAFDGTYAPREGVARFASGTPPILSLEALSGALEAIEGLPLIQLQDKARALGALAIARAQGMGLEILSPADDSVRGGHVSVRIPEGYPVVQALAARGVMADFRVPDTVRFGFSPLFLSYETVWDAMDALANILSSRSWDQPQFHARARVT